LWCLAQVPVVGRVCGMMAGSPVGRVRALIDESVSGGRTRRAVDGGARGSVGWLMVTSAVGVGPDMVVLPTIGRGRCRRVAAAVGYVRRGVGASR
jgi:hypothetical protein